MRTWSSTASKLLELINMIHGALIISDLYNPLQITDDKRLEDIDALQMDADCVVA